MILSVESLRFRYPDVPRGRKAAPAKGDGAGFQGSNQALRDVSFSMASPSLMALLGPNGSGKSTLFRILSTLLAPQAGCAMVCGINIAQNPSEVRRRIGLVFQEPSLDPKLTVRENLQFAGNLYAMQGAALKSRVENLASRMAIELRLDAPVHTLSGGLRRRAEIARALLHQPSLLLLDEPSSGLDPQGRLDLWRYLRSLQVTEHVAVLASTHFLDEGALCDQIVILHEGHVAIQGAPGALRDELGGEVVEVVTDRARELGDLLAPRAGFHVRVVDDVVRVECPNGAAFIANISASHGSWIRELRMHRPSLADVYFHATGELFRP